MSVIFPSVRWARIRLSSSLIVHADLLICTDDYVLLMDLLVNRTNEQTASKMFRFRFGKINSIFVE